MGTGGQHRVTLSMVEIYNEAVRSGLNRAGSGLRPQLLLARPPTKPSPFSPGTS